MTAYYNKVILTNRIPVTNYTSKLHP